MTLVGEVMEDTAGVHEEFKALRAAARRNDDGVYVMEKMVRAKITLVAYTSDEDGSSAADSEACDYIHDPIFSAFPAGGSDVSAPNHAMRIYSVVQIRRAVSAEIARSTPLALRIVFQSTKKRASSSDEGNTVWCEEPGVN